MKKAQQKIRINTIEIIFFQILFSVMIFTASFADESSTNHDENPGIDIKNIKEYFNSFDLTKHDKEFKGHTIEKHVSKSKDWLEGRMSADRHAKFASTYTDIKTANDVIKDVILSNETKIIDWIEKDENKNRISTSKKFENKIGLIIKKGEQEFQDCNTGVVVLKRGNRNSKKFYIVTSYPVSNEIKIGEKYKKKYWKDNKIKS